MNGAESQKMTEMKKAYASIILHTAQEAAARIMASERRAFRFQKEAADAKENALQMLLKLKLMMDSKMREADVIASRDKKKIKELEGQLKEAKITVGELIEELANVRDELEREMKRERSQSPNDKLSNYLGNGSEYAETCYNTVTVASESILESCSNSKNSPNLTSDGTEATLAQRKDESQFLKIRDPALMGHFGGVPYLPSIIKRTKLPHIYGNGFTQKIHASKGNKLGGPFCSSDGDAHAKENTIVDSMMLDLSSKDNISSSGGTKVQGELITNEVELHNFPDKGYHAEQRKHLEHVKSNTSVYEHFPRWELAHHETTGHLSSKVASEENSVKCSKGESQKAIESSLPTKLFNLKTQTGYVQAKENNVNLVKACRFRNTSGSDNKEVDVINIEEGGVAKPLAAKVTTVNENFHIPCNSNAGADSVKSNEGSFTFTTDVIQYTRKRNRKTTESANCQMEASPKHSYLRRKTSEGQTDLLPDLSKQTNDSKLSKNWESQSIEQVAHQLLALSDEKCYH